MNFYSAITAIMVKLAKAGFEQTQYIYMKEPVLVGRNVNGPVYCTAISESSEGGFFMNIIFDERPSDLYGNDFDFTFACYSLSGNLSFTENGKNFDIQMNPDAIPQVLIHLDHWGDEWLTYQTDLQIKNRKYLRWAIQDNKEPLTWAEQLEWKSTKAIIDKLSHNRKRNIEMEQYMKMEAMGETKWNEKADEENRIANEVLAEMIEENKNQMI